MMADANAYDQLVAEAQRVWRDEPGRAQRALVGALSLRPERPEAYLLLADLLVDTGRVQRAELYYQAGVHYAPQARGRLLHYYLEQGLPLAALALADGLLDTAALEHLRAAYPPHRVSMAITVLGVGPSLQPTLDAVAGQSHPIEELLVVSDGLDQAALDEARARGAVVLQRPGLSLGQARLWALESARGEFVGYVDRRVAPSTHWLTRLVTHLDLRHHFDGDPPWLCRDAGAATGHLVEAHAHRLADAWRALHLIEHYMGGWGPAVLWMYAGAGLYRRDVVLPLARSAPLSDEQPDAELAERMRAAGWRVAYEEYALCLRHTSDALADTLRAVRHHTTPYYMSAALARYEGGGLDEVARVLPDRIKRGRVEMEVDNLGDRGPDLAVASLLVGPALVLGDLAQATARAAVADRPAIEQTHAAAYLAVFALLGELGVERDLIELLATLLADYRPRQPELASLCEWAGVEATLGLARGGSFNPFEFLPKRDQTLVSTLLRELGTELGGWSAADWAAVRRSALLLLGESATPRSRVALVSEPNAEVDALAGALRLGGAAVLKVSPYDERAQSASLSALLGFSPDVVVVRQPTAGRWGLSAEELLADWCLEVAEQLESAPGVVAWTGTGSADALAQAAPNITAVCRDAAEVTNLVGSMP